MVGGEGEGGTDFAGSGVGGFNEVGGGYAPVRGGGRAGAVDSVEEPDGAVGASGAGGEEVGHLGQGNCPAGRAVVAAVARGAASGTSQAAGRWGAWVW